MILKKVFALFLGLVLINLIACSGDNLKYNKKDFENLHGFDYFYDEFRTDDTTLEIGDKVYYVVQDQSLNYSPNEEDYNNYFEFNTYIRSLIIVAHGEIIDYQYRDYSNDEWDYYFYVIKVDDEFAKDIRLASESYHYEGIMSEKDILAYYANENE